MRDSPTASQCYGRKHRTGLPNIRQHARVPSKSSKSKLNLTLLLCDERELGLDRQVVGEPLRLREQRLRRPHQRERLRRVEDVVLVVSRPLTRGARHGVVEAWGGTRRAEVRSQSAIS